MITPEQEPKTATEMLPSRDIILSGFAVEGRREWRWEFHEIGAWWREDVQVGRSLCSSFQCMHPKRY